MGVDLTQTAARGSRFPRHEYRGRPLPEWARLHLELPRPDWPPDPSLVNAYWRVWELACAHLRRPAAGRDLLSAYLDPCLGGPLRLADSAWMTMFMTLGHGLVPAAEMLDNFYHAQHPDGEICQELTQDGQDHPAWVNREEMPLFTRRTGRPVPLGRAAPTPALTLDGLHSPLAAWAELCHWRQSGDSERLREVWAPLLAYHDALWAHLRHANGLLVADWASMENSPRNAGLLCGVDIASQMVLSARALAELAPAAAAAHIRAGDSRAGLAARREARRLAEDADALAARIREAMWDPATAFFYDLRADGTRHNVQTIAAYWTLVAGVATADQARSLAAWLGNPQGFDGPAGPPTLATGHEAFDPRGGYYRGAVWPPLVLMVCRGLQRYGLGDLAHRIACRHLGVVARVCAETGTIWENYAPDGSGPGRPARGDFVGQSGVIATLLLEQVLGLEANAPGRQLIWTVRTLRYSGCQLYRVAGTRVQVQAPARAQDTDPLYVLVEADQPVELIARVGAREIRERVTAPRELVL